MPLAGALNDSALNEVAINARVGEPLLMGDAMAALRFDAFVDPRIVGNVVISEAFARIGLAPFGSATVSPGSEGVAEIKARGRDDGTSINPALFEGAVLGIALHLNDEGITLSPGSEGVASVRLVPRLSPYIWTYLYNAGTANIDVRALVDPRYRPPLPAAFYPAFEWLAVSPDARGARVSPDADNIEVSPDRHRLHVPKETSR